MIENIKNTDKIIVDIEMLQIDFNEQKIKSVRQEIADKYNIPVKNVEVRFKPITIDDNGKKISLTKDIQNNIQNASHQKSMMQDYIKLKGYTDINWDDIDAIDNQVNAFIDFDQYTKYKNYKFKYVKWSNYLSYGEDNYFDFTKLHGLVLLNSEPANQGGKTTFAIDLLRFALFGKADKSPNLDSVFNSFNPEATTVTVEAGLEIEGEDYVIRRTVTRPALKKRTEKSKCKQTLEYFKLIGDNLELLENCEGESVQQTNNIIKDAVGNVEDFNLVISATSYTLGDLLRMGQTDKGRIFSRWLGLLSVEKKEEIAKKLWKENYSKKLLSNEYVKQDLLTEIDDYNAYNEELNNCITKANKNIADVDKNIENYNNNKNEKLRSLKPVIDNVDKINVESETNKLNNKKRELESKTSLHDNYIREYELVKNITFNEDDVIATTNLIEKYKAAIKSIELANAEIKVEIKHYRDKISEVNELIKKGICVTCGHVIDNNEQQKFIDEYNEKINNLIQKGVNNKNRIDNGNLEISKLNDKLVELNNKRTQYNNQVNLSLKISSIKSQIETLTLEIKNIEDTLELVKNNSGNIAHNATIYVEINIIDSSIKNENDVKNQNIRDIATWENTIKTNNSEILKRKDIIERLNKEEKIIRNWNVYQELVGKNGIIKLVLKNALPIINNEISRILNGLCDFETRLEIDEKNNVVINLVKDGVAMDMSTAASGFEGTIASLALRSALASISTFSKPNFIVFDEVLSGVASNNYENIHELYKRIASSYDFILNITHKEEICHWHNQIITVTKECNISKLKEIL